MEQLLEMNAFADGQVGSKLWACRELETLQPEILPPNPVIWIFGGWVGVMAFLLLSRERIQPSSVVSFDLDARATKAADLINKNWEMNGRQFVAQNADCSLESLWDGRFGAQPDLLINTSCEHFLENDWFDRIPSGTTVLLQATDQKHEAEPVRLAYSVDDLEGRFPRLFPVFYRGVREFQYTERSFSRYMLIGKKA